MNKNYMLTLMKTPKIGRRTVKKIIDLMDSNPTSLIDLHDLLKAIKQNHANIILPSMEQLKVAHSNAENIIIRAENLGIKIISYIEPDFPQQLKIISDPPVLLYTKGNIACLNTEHLIAVIGTRKPTKYGRDMAECFGMLLGEKGIVVVSGLALGCDTAAHQGCLNTGGKTVAVLANGLDTIYPKQNKALAEQIIENSGCLLSEYPPGEKIMSNYFVERDRLQSGLSLAVIVVETGIKGGTIHTVNFAIKQSKILACLDHPEHIVTNNSKGNKILISEGKALPITDLKDIEELFKKVFNMPKKKKSNNIEIISANNTKQLILPVVQEDKGMG